LYRKKSKDVPTFINLILFLLRFFIFFFVFFLLLKPELKKQQKIIELPKFVFLQDNSQSIILNKDSSYYKIRYLEFLDSLFINLDLDIDFFSFDSSLNKGKPNFQGQFTNFATPLDEVSDIYSNSNVVAYLFASDGIYNQGFQPLYFDKNLNAPLYTVLLGDTTRKKDVAISTVKCNKISYLGNQTPVEVLLDINGMQGSNLVFEVFDTIPTLAKKSLFSQNIKVKKQEFVSKINFLINPVSSGIQDYYVRIKSDVEERNIDNNMTSFFIDVIDDRKKILILFDNHHPDIEAIKSALEYFDQYRVETEWVKDFDKSEKIQNYKDYSLIILHQVPIVEQLTNIDIPIWYILGKNSNLDSFNSIQDFVYFPTTDTSFELVNFEVNDNFSSFIINDSISSLLSLSTPFLTPFKQPSVIIFEDVLLYKKIGSLNTEQPLLFFAEKDIKYAYLLGEGLWRWRLNDSYLNNNNLSFNTIISKIVQYLLLDQKKKRLHVDYNPINSVNELILFEAELYNKNFELINSFDLDMEIIDSIGNTFHYKFTPFEDRYFLETGLVKGKYNFIVTASLKDELLVDKGSFVVSSFSVEKNNLRADYKLLSELALKHNGTIVTLDSLETVLKSIKKNVNFTPKTYIDYDFKPLISFKSFFLLISFLLFLEWILRRYYINF